MTTGPKPNKKMGCETCTHGRVSYDDGETYEACVNCYATWSRNPSLTRAQRGY